MGLTKNSPQEIIDTVKFVKRLYPRSPKTNDWQVVVVRSLENNNEYKLVGRMVVMDTNFEYKVGGTLEYNERYNEWQYACTYSQEVFEFRTLEDQRTFLSFILNDKQLNGIFDMFPNPLDIIKEGNVQELIKVKGIGIKTANMIITRYEGCKDKSKAYVELGKYGFSKALIEKLVNIYKSPDIAVDAIKENPYKLVEDVKGIGFKKADEIALKMDFSEHDVRRCIAFVIHYFRECADSGDSYVDYEELLQAIDDVLGTDYPDQSINDAMRLLDNDNKLWVRDCTDEDGYEYTLVGLKHYYDVEKGIRDHIERLMSFPSNITLTREEALERIREREEAQGWKFTDKQIEGIFLTMENNVTIVTGYGGTGKTSTVAGMLACANDGYDFKQCALSGKASVNLYDVTGEEGQTIHSLLGYLPKSGFAINKNNQLDTDLVILDEASMVDIELALALLEAIPNGAKLIMLGDVNQLEAIGAGNLLNDLIESGKVPYIEFDKIHRQGAKSAIKTESKEIAEGRAIVDSKWVGEKVLGDLKDLKYIGFSHPYGSDEIRPTVGYIFNEFKALYKEAKDIKNISVIVPTKSNGSACYPLNLKIQDYVLPRNRGKCIELGTEKEPYKLYVGDKVINLKNNRKTYNYDSVGNKIERPIYNGNMGEVVDIISDDTILVDFYNIGEVYIHGDQLNNIALGYAITVHKAQGSTIPYVIGAIDYTHYSMLTRQLVYTLISRAKTKMSFVFETKALLHAIRTNKVTTKRTFLYHLLVGEIE